MSRSSSTVISAASNEWANRPDDQRYLSLEELRSAVAKRKDESWTATPHTRDIEVISDNGKLAAQLYDPSRGDRVQLAPTHFAFGQLCQFAQTPASYMRTLPAELARINMQWGLEHNSMRDDALVLAQSNGDNHLRAITSQSYGRIWDMQVVDAVSRMNIDGRWKIPAASYATQNPRRATTLYASDRDVFIFLVDDAHPIEVPGEEKPLFRGFYTWNSEVGATTFGIATFLYQYVCDNRTIWGATNVQELRIRHTGGAPERFAYEGAKYLSRYGDESTSLIVDRIKAASAKELDIANVDNSRDKGVQAWLQKKGFTKGESVGAVSAANVERGGTRSLWDIVNGVTAHARTIAHTDERTVLETKAGKLMELAA